MTDLGEDDLGENVQAARGIEGEDAGDVHSQEGDDEDNVVALKSEQGVSNNVRGDNIDRTLTE